MSRDRRDPLRPIPQLPATPRWAPSTPHAIRALQQRSGGRRKSAINTRPDSARNILRRLARITARDARRRPSTPLEKPSTPINKKVTYRLSIPEDEDFENENEPERPDFTLPIDEEDEDDGLGAAPRARELPGGENFTFTSIDFAARPTRSPTSVQSERVRRSSGFSLLPLEDKNIDGGDSEGDDTIQSVEFGRRAVSEGPAWDRYPRSSFGSIRMSEFGLEENKERKALYQEPSLVLDNQYELGFNAADDDDVHFDIGGDTEELQQVRHSMSEPIDGDSVVHEGSLLEDRNRVGLEFGQASGPFEASVGHIEAEENESLQQTVGEVTLPPSSQEIPEPHSPSSCPTSLELPGPKAERPVSIPRRKRQKFTKKGNTVPSLPSSLVKRVAVDSVARTGKKRPVIDRESLEALEQATEWFFEQVGEDLEVYANHAKGRKRIDDADVVALMKRQRMVSQDRGLDDLAEKFLPEDVLCDLQLPNEP